MKSAFRALRASTLALLSALLVACGGEELVPFSPARLIVFGDQASLIVAGATPTEGRKYTINYLDSTTGLIDCGSNLLWVQVLASSYNISFPECALPAEAALVGQMRALAGATGGGGADIDLTAQVTRQLELDPDAGGGINDSDMVTVFIGVNDVVSAYQRYKAGEISSDAAVALAEAAGETIAGQVNRIANAGGRVILSTIPDVGVTPYANGLDPADAEMLTRLTERVNARLLVTIDNDGRKIGLIELNPFLSNVIFNPAAYGMVDVKNAACIPLDPLLCTNDPASLKPDASSTNWLWASALQFGPRAQTELGNLAASRAHNQPF